MRLLSSEGLSPKDQLVLKSMVDLLSIRTDDRWKYVEGSLHVEGTVGDVVLIDIDNLEDPERITAAAEARQAVVIEYSMNTEAQTSHYRVQKPLRAAALISLLNLAGMRQGPTEDADRGRRAATQPAPEILDRLDVQDDEHPSWLKISTTDAECVVDLVNERYHMKGAHLLHDLLLTPGKSMTFSRESLAPTGHGSGWVSLPHLKWRFGITLSGGQLCSSLRQRQRFKLTRWPPQDIARSYPDTLTFSALLSRKSGASIEEICESSGAPAEVVIGFINGAQLSGSLSDKIIGPTDPAGPSGRKPGDNGLFRKIRERLKRRTK